MKSIYYIDTSSIGELNDKYPPKIFKNTIWADIANLIDEERLFSCNDVFKELQNKTGKHNHLVHTWSKHKHIFHELGAEEFSVIREIVDEFPKAIPETSKHGVHADTSLIAFCKTHNATVITEENGKGMDKIPFLCYKKGVKWVNILGLMEKENWTY